MLFATEVKNFTCIRCPLGCPLEVSLDDNGEVLEISGYTCNRGKVYARQEATQPVRMITAVVPARGCLEPVSVKTAESVPKESIPDVLAQIRGLKLTAPVRAGQILLDDVAGTGIPVIATKSVG